MPGTVTNILYTLGFFQGILIGILLLRQKSLKSSAIYLGLFIIVLSIEVLNQSHLTLADEFIYWVNNGNLFLIGPLLFLFVQANHANTHPSRRTHWLHLAIFFIVKTGTLLLGPTGWGAQLLSGTFYFFLNVFLSIYGLSYAIIIWVHTRKYWVREKSNLNRWIHRLAIIHAMGWAFSIIAKLIAPQSEFIGGLFWIFSYLTMVIIIYFIGIEFMAIPKYLTFNRAKYDRSILKTEELQKLEENLKRLLEEEKVFLDATLNREKLATLLGTTTHQLSQFLNHHAGLDYHLLIQRARIGEVKTRLKDPGYAHYAILGIAMECGFSTKSTFNRAFKTHTGQTPSEYMTELQETGN